MDPFELPQDDHTDDSAKTQEAEPSGAPRPADASRRPGFRFMTRHPAHWIALGFGSGLVPHAPGTAGTLWAWVAWLILGLGLDSAQLGVLLAVSVPVAWWAATRTAQHLRLRDPGAIVVDEIVAFWLILWLLLPAGFWAQCAAFVLFRFFDMIKPGPIGWADRLYHNASGWRGGFGILLDDMVAAGCSLLVIALARVWW